MTSVRLAAITAMVSVFAFADTLYPVYTVTTDGDGIATNLLEECIGVGSIAIVIAQKLNCEQSQDINDHYDDSNTANDQFPIFQVIILHTYSPSGLHSPSRSLSLLAQIIHYKDEHSRESRAGDDTQNPLTPVEE